MVPITRYRFFIPWMSVLMALCLAGCNPGGKFRSPDLSGYVPGKWQAASSGAKGPLDSSRQPMSAWWRQFNDKTLTALVEKLAGANIPLAEARQRIIEAMARRGVIGADKLPQVEAAATYTHAAAGDKAVSFQGPPAGTSANLYTAGVAAGWELDFWGHTKRLVEAANADIAAARADYRDMRVSLAAELTLAYIDVRTLQARIDMVRENISLQEKTLALARSRFQAGTGTALGVSQANQLLESTRARIPALGRALAAAENRISLLLGQAPGKEVLAPGRLPEVPKLIGLGLPVDLLTRRPDIRRALQRYHAAVARTQAAEADRYPRLSLSGTLTLQSDTVGGMINKDALIYTLGPGLHFPLFTGGRIKSNIAVRKSQAVQARLALTQSILKALSEVETAAAGVVRSQEQVASLGGAAASARRSVRLAHTLYQTGLGDSFQVIDAEQKLVSAQESLLLAKQQALGDVVQLYRALGGGWQVAAGGSADVR